MRLAFLLAILAPGSAVQAQPAAGPVADPVTRQEGSAEASPACELHVFPTADFIDSSPDYSASASAYGVAGALIGDALTSAEKSGSGKLIGLALEQMQGYLTSEVQFEEIRSAGIVALLKLPAGTRLIMEAPLPSEDRVKNDPSLKPRYDDYSRALRKSVAIVNSGNPCYRELRVVYVAVSKGLGSMKLSASFVYRTFDAQHAEQHLYDGERSVPRPGHFPALAPDQIALADEELRTAFHATLTDWIAHRVKL